MERSEGVSEATTPPAGLAFEASCSDLDVTAVSWVQVSSTYPCSDCRNRGGWMPRVWQSDCPMCYGDDPYGQNSYCAECEFCCGC